MKDYIELSQKLFPVALELEETRHNFFKGGLLFKRSQRNEYCFINDNSDEFISFFKSGWIPLEKIEKDWLDSEISFLVQNAQETKLFIERMV